MGYDQSRYKLRRYMQSIPENEYNKFWWMSLTQCTWKVI